MFQVEFKIKGNADAVLDQVISLIKDKKGLLQVVGRRAAEELKNHFAILEGEHPNKMGGKRSHFWRQVRDAVQVPQLLGTEQVVVAIANPVIAHKVGIGPAGGWIRPKEKKWLSIPAIAEAYDKSPLEYAEGGGTDHDLVFIKKSEETAFLAQVKITKTDDQSVEKTKQKVEMTIVFVLKKKVYQAPVPYAMPTAERWNKALGDEMRDYFNREIAKGSQDQSGETLK
jgi:hypothetical protein